MYIPVKSSYIVILHELGVIFSLLCMRKPRFGKISAQKVTRTQRRTMNWHGFESSFFAFQIEEYFIISEKILSSPFSLKRKNPTILNCLSGC